MLWWRCIFVWVCSDYCDAEDVSLLRCRVLSIHYPFHLPLLWLKEAARVVISVINLLVQ